MAESDTLIQSMNTRINELTNQLASRKEQAKRHVEQAKATAGLQTRVAALEAENDTLKKERDAAPSALRAELDDVRGQLRARDHRDAWRAALGDQLNDGVPIEDVWGKLQYTPGEAVPTPDQIREQVKPAQVAAPYLFKQGATPANGLPGGAKPSAPPPPLVAPVAPSRGAPDNYARRFEVRKADTRDPAWMKQNYAAMTEARKAGTLHFVDE